LAARLKPAKVVVEALVMARRSLPLLVAVVALAAAAPVAQAGKLAASGSRVTYTAAAGEVNRVTVTAAKGSVTVRDAGAPVTGCTAIDPDKARCDGTFGRVTLSLGDGADRARATGIAATFNGGSGADRLTGGAKDDTLSGSAGNDVLSGGAGDDLLLGDAGNDRLLGGPGRDELDGDVGNDTLVGGPAKDSYFGFVGRDRIDAVDGVKETVDCGNDSDFARVDLRDRIQFCEHRTRVRSDTPAGR
jgi:Ca2+-binding RTX toxin-like protein